ncbi:hypothetical protein GEMRC1_008451 [Eukaryota sp. GEM-RC1]
MGLNRRDGSSEFEQKEPPQLCMSTRPTVSSDLCYIENQRKRYVTLSKRRSTLINMAQQLHQEDNCEVLLCTVSEAGVVVMFASENLQPLAHSDTLRDMLRSSLDGNSSC